MERAPEVVPGYDLHRPKIDDLQSILTTLLGREQAEAHLSRAMRVLRLAEGDLEQLPTSELIRLSEFLIKQRGLVSILARSFWIRLSNWEQLSSPGGAS